MTKNELRTGMIITCRNGYEYMVIADIKCGNNANSKDGETFAIGNDGSSNWANLSEDFTNDLKCKVNSEFDIMSVKYCQYPREIYQFLTDEDVEDINYRPLWTREEKKKYTYSQLKELLGEEFEIVKE